MSIESTLNELYEMGCGPVVIGRPNPQETQPGGPKFFAKSMLRVETGGLGNVIAGELQGTGDSIGLAVDTLKLQVVALDKLTVKQSGVLVPCGNGRLPKLR